MGEDIGPELRKTQRLTAYAGKRRYSQLEQHETQGPPVEVRKSDYDLAVQAAEYALSWSEERIAARLTQRASSENAPAETAAGVPDRTNSARRPGRR